MSGCLRVGDKSSDIVENLLAVALKCDGMKLPEQLPI